MSDVILLSGLALLSFAVAAASAFALAVLFSVNPLRLRADPRAGRNTSELWFELKKRLDRPASFLMLLGTGAVAFGGMTLGATLWQNAGPWFWFASVALAVAVTVAVEVWPRSLGVRYNIPAARVLGVPLGKLAEIKPLEGATPRPGPALPATHPDEPADKQIMNIVTLAEAAAAEKLIHSLEEIIIIHAATLSARRVSAVMTPRDQVSFLRLDENLRENLSRLRARPHSRYPVSPNENPDGIAWTALARDFAIELATADGGAVGSLRLLPLPALRPDDNLTRALEVLLESRQGVAQVRTADNRFAGLITLRDISRLLFSA